MMTGPNVAPYDQTVELIHTGYDDLVRTLVPAVVRARQWLTSLTGLVLDTDVQLAVVKFLVSFSETVRKLVAFLGDLLIGVSAPIVFLVSSSEWKGTIKQLATDATGIINGLPVGSGHDPLWKGRGADSYRGKVDPQGAATDHVAAICDKFGDVMGDLGRAGLTLYGAVLALIVTVTGGLAAIVTEIASIVGIAFVPGTGLTVVGVAGAIVAFISSIKDYIVTVQEQAQDLESMIDDNSVFTGAAGAGLVGGWPVAVTTTSAGVLGDGTVTDGDVEWSVPRR